MEIQYINIDEGEFISKKMIYKYMPLDYAIETIKNRYLWFSNPEKWKDPFEKRFINAKYLVNKNLYDFPLKGKVFSTCLTQTTSCEAHWSNYANGQIGISLKIKRQQLLEILKCNTDDYDIYIGKVNYLRTDEIRKRLSEIEQIKDFSPLNLNNREMLIRLLLLKRVAFRYEDEIRIFAIKKNKTREHGVKISYSIMPNELIDTITIDPNVRSNTEDLLKNFFKQVYDFSKVYKSQLYSMSNNIEIKI